MAIDFYYIVVLVLFFVEREIFTLLLAKVAEERRVLHWVTPMERERGFLVGQREQELDRTLWLPAYGLLSTGEERFSSRGFRNSYTVLEEV